MQKKFLALILSVFAMPAFAGSLQDKIAVDYEGQAAEFVRLVSGRLNLPFLNLSSSSEARISLRQGQGGTVEQALNRANASLRSQGIQVGVYQGRTGQRVMVMYEPGRLPDLGAYFDAMAPSAAPKPVMRTEAPSRIERPSQAASQPKPSAAPAASVSAKTEISAPLRDDVLDQEEVLAMEKTAAAFRMPAYRRLNTSAEQKAPLSVSEGLAVIGVSRQSDEIVLRLSRPVREGVILEGRFERFYLSGGKVVIRGAEGSLRLSHQGQTVFLNI